MVSQFRRAAIAALLIGVAGNLAGFAPAPSSAPAAQRPEDGSEYKKIIDTAGPAMVTVKFVMKSPDDQGFGDEEMEVSGLIVDPKGLVLCSYWFLGGAANMFGGGAGPKPQDIKILIGDDTEGKKARLISHDSELDLAWIKLDEEPATPLKHIDLEKGATGSIGQRVFLLSRLDKYFDRSPVINEGRLRGETTKPRRLFSPSGDLLADPRNDIGLPVFNADAGVVGFIVVQVPDRESMEATQDIGGGPMILPVEAVAAATKKALEAQNNPEAPKADAPAADGAPPAPTPEKKD